jgi:predicted DNA-binding transcriptional regulator
MELRLEQGMKQALNHVPSEPQATKLANDRTLGGGVLAGSIIGIIVYGLLLCFWPIRVLEITAFLAVVVLLGILAWIGWTMATTPPPESITEATQTLTTVSAGKQLKHVLCLQESSFCFRLIGAYFECSSDSSTYFF